MARCTECKHYRYWPATYWEPDDSDCAMLDNPKAEIPEEVIDAMYCEGKDIIDEDDPRYCPYFTPAPAEEDYWDRYAWEENHYDKDER